MKVEFFPWYEAGASLLRCSGDAGCGALLVSGDTEVHMKWHKRLDDIEVLAVRIERIENKVQSRRVVGTW